MGEAGGCPVHGWAAYDPSGTLAPYKFFRKVCNKWGDSKYPLVPGHEIVGVVMELGSKVPESKFKVGQQVGVGCMVCSCLSCEECKLGVEQTCNKVVWTYDSVDFVDGSITKGGYSTIIIVDHKFVLKMPENLPLDAAAPLLYAGITMYSPMRYFRMDMKGTNFGLLLGADEFIISKDLDRMKAAAKSMDCILDTVAYAHSLDPYLRLLKTNGKLVTVGIPEKPLSFHARHHSIGGNTIGGIQETQEMLDFAGKHNV
ncbi:unnamed protein product [Sphagnum balticum]